MQEPEKSSTLPAEKEPIRFDNVETAVNELSVMSANGTDKTEQLGMPERCLYYALFDLYRRHRTGELSTEDCKRLKLTAVKQYEKDRNEQDWYVRLIQNHAKLWEHIERAGTVYAKSPRRTPEADAFYQAVYGCLPKDRTLEETEEMVREDAEYRRCGINCDMFVNRGKTDSGYCTMRDLDVPVGELCYYTANGKKTEKEE